MSYLIYLHKYLISQMANNPRFEKQTVSNTGTREKHVPKMAKAGVSTSRVNTPGFYLAWAARCLPWAASWVSQVCGPLWDWRCCFLPLSPPVTAYLWVSEQSLPSTSRAVSRRTLPPMGSSWRNPALLLPGLALQSYCFLLFRTGRWTGPPELHCLQPSISREETCHLGLF